MKLNHLILSTTLIFLSCSCSTQKTSPLPYFQDVEQAQTSVSQPPIADIKLLPGDELLINVSSVIPAASSEYNMMPTNPDLMSNMGMSTTPQQTTYVVDSEGYINFPVLGKIKAEGMTVESLCDYITKEVSKTVADPTVKVSLVNFRVNVLGEVKKPSSIQVTRTRYTILDALADAGDLTEYGERDNVLLIRQNGDVQERVTLDLNSTDVLTSPYFYLHPNDVIYVKPNKVRIDNSRYNTNNGYKLSVISTIVSASSVIASLVIALTVK